MTGRSRAHANKSADPADCAPWSRIVAAGGARTLFQRGSASPPEADGRASPPRRPPTSYGRRGQARAERHRRIAVAS